MHFIDPKLGNNAVAALKTIQKNQLHTKYSNNKRHSSKTIYNKQRRADVQCSSSTALMLMYQSCVCTVMSRWINYPLIKPYASYSLFSPVRLPPTVLPQPMELHSDPQAHVLGAANHSTRRRNPKWSGARRRLELVHEEDQQKRCRLFSQTTDLNSIKQGSAFRSFMFFQHVIL